MITKVYVIPNKMKVTVDNGTGSIYDKERYYTKEVPDSFQLTNRKWRYLDEKRGYVEVEVEAGDLTAVSEAPATYPGVFAKAIRISDGHILKDPIFLPDAQSQRRGTITAEGKTYLQGSEYRWQKCDSKDIDAVEIHKPQPVKDATTVIPFEEGIPNDVGVLDKDLGIPVSILQQKIAELEKP